MSRHLNRKKMERELDDNADSEVVSVLMIMMTMKISWDDGRQTGVPMGVWLNLWAPLYPRPPPGYRRSTAGERRKREKEENRRATSVSRRTLKQAAGFV